MSLRLWLPLNGTLENKGLASVTVTNNGATVDSGGKIGQCYSFNGSNSKIVNTLSSAVTSSVGTLCCWVKMNSLPGSSSFYNLIQLGSLGGYAACRLGIYIEYSNYINISIDGGGTGSNRYTHSLVADKWYHICATNDGTTVKLYIDGDEVLSKSSNKSSYTTAAPYLYVGGTSSYFLNGYMNDVRYYDNILSEKEIKEIAKGLVLHLPLNNNGLGNENLLRNSNFYTGTTAHWGPVNSSTVTVESKDGYLCGTGTKGTSNNILYQNNGSYTGNESIDITVSAKVYVNSTGTFTVGNWVSTTSASGWQSLSGTRIWNTSNNLKIGWNYVSTTLKNATNQYTGNIITAFGYSGTTFWITDVKLEKGVKATPWSPNPEDEDYPASGSGIPENLFVATDMSEPITANSSTDWTKHFRMYNGSAAIHTIDTTEMTDTIALTTAKSNLGIAFARLNSEINLDPTQYYTISCEAKCTNADLKLCIGLSYYNDQSTWVWRGGNNAKSFTTADTWQKITHTFKPDANTYAICYCFTINPGASPSGTDTFSIRKCKLEKGSVATEWQPSPIDDSYKTLGYYNNITFDQSGYNYNAVKHGTISYSSDAPKYNVSMFFDGTNRISTSALPAETKTISVWVKTTKNKSTAQCICGDSASALCLFFYSGGLITYFKGSAGGTGSRVTFGSEYKENDWNHLVVVKTGDTTRDVYCNGVLLTPAANNYYSPATGLWIGQRNATGALPFYGYLSDFRAYVTALSEDYVKSLYNNNAYIDSDGKIYGEIR